MVGPHQRDACQSPDSFDGAIPIGSNPARTGLRAIPMREDLMTAVQQVAREELSDWPADWTGFTWPGYTYEHTLRVRSLGLALADRLGADRRVVELASLLHDTGKPLGEPHSHTGADRTEALLSDLGVDGATRDAVCGIIRTHLDKSAAGCPEAVALYDADFIDANFGYVAMARYLTIRAHREQTVEEMTAAAQEWLEGMEEKLGHVFTEPGRVAAEERYARMALYLNQLRADLRESADGHGWALGLARFIASDGSRPSLLRQLRAIEECGTRSVPHLEPSADLSQFAYFLRQEIEGLR